MINITEYCPWHGICSNAAITETRRSRWQLARDRMEGRGLPFFRKGIYKGNKTYYLAAPILAPDLPFWEACRERLTVPGLTTADASPEDTWAALVHCQLKAPALFAGSPLTTSPRRPARLLEDIERAFKASAHNSPVTGQLF